MVYTSNEHVMVWAILFYIYFRSEDMCIQFNSIQKLIFPGAIQTCEQYNICSYIYTKQHRFIGQTQANTTYTFI